MLCILNQAHKVKVLFPVLRETTIFPCFGHHYIPIFWPILCSHVLVTTIFPCFGHFYIPMFWPLLYSHVLATAATRAPPPTVGSRRRRNTETELNSMLLVQKKNKKILKCEMKSCMPSAKKVQDYSNITMTTFES